jgi:hypothetical protein
MFSPGQMLLTGRHPLPVCERPDIEELRIAAGLVIHTRPFLVRAAMVAAGSDLRSL